MTYELAVTATEAVEIARVRLVVDAATARLRELWVWDPRGRLLESYRFERIEPFTGPDAVFAPDCPEYDF